MMLVMTGCATTPEKAENKAVLSAEVNEAVAVFKEKDPSIQTFFEKSYGYAVLPKVAKGPSGLAWRAQGLGLQPGQDDWILQNGPGHPRIFLRRRVFPRDYLFPPGTGFASVTAGEFSFSAQATATAIAVGAAAKTDYKDGIAVFVMADRGLMVDASLGGQNFKFDSNTIQ